MGQKLNKGGSFLGKEIGHATRFYLWKCLKRGRLWNRVHVPWDDKSFCISGELSETAKFAPPILCKANYL